MSQWGFSITSWLIFLFAAFLVGFAKTGLPGITVLAVPLMAMILPPRISVGVLLPVFMLADMLSIASYLKYARWRYVFPYILFVVIGVSIASVIIKVMDESNFGVLIGCSVIFLLVVTILVDWKKKRISEEDLPVVTKPPFWLSSFFGVTAGTFSALANASSPIVAIYVMTGRLPKFQFLGTSALCAFTMNWTKFPVFIFIGIINWESMKLSLTAVPMIAAGGVIGILTAKRLSQEAFRKAVLILTFIASLKLIIG
jgi:uncharacterized membrane protein YfcA